jgi:hypothetical protein
MDIYSHVTAPMHGDAAAKLDAVYKASGLSATVWATTTI